MCSQCCLVSNPKLFAESKQGSNLCGTHLVALLCVNMATDSLNFEAATREVGPLVRSRSPARAEPSPIGPDETPLMLVNLPEEGPNEYTYHHGPESDSRVRLPASQLGHAAVWDPCGGGAFSLCA